jgi:excisionase family DNA binding protein
MPPNEIASHLRDVAPGARAAYSITEVADYSSIGRTGVYAAIRDGHLVARKIGRRTVILAKDLEAWLEALPSCRAANSKVA